MQETLAGQSVEKSSIKKNKVIGIREYHIKIQGMLKIKAENFEDIKFNEIRLSELEQMDIISVHKEKSDA